MPELPKSIALASLLIIFATCLIAATRHALSPPQQRTLPCIFWSVCSALMWVGTAGIIYALLFPPSHFTEKHYLLGAIPAEFGTLAVIAKLGFLGALAGLLSKGVVWLYQRPKH